MVSLDKTFFLTKKKNKFQTMKEKYFDPDIYLILKIH